MSSPTADGDASRDAPKAASTDTSASAGDDANPLWLLVAASALFFALSAGLLASG